MVGVEGMVLLNQRTSGIMGFEGFVRTEFYSLMFFQLLCIRRIEVHASQPIRQFILEIVQSHFRVSASAMIPNSQGYDMFRTVSGKVTLANMNDIGCFTNNIFPKFCVDASLQSIRFLLDSLDLCLSYNNFH